MARQIMRIEVTADANKRLAQLHKQTGMTNVAIHSRMIEWLSRQPVAVRDDILTGDGQRAARGAIEHLARR